MPNKAISNRSVYKMDLDLDGQIDTLTIIEKSDDCPTFEVALSSADGVEALTLQQFVDDKRFIAKINAYGYLEIDFNISGGTYPDSGGYYPNITPCSPSGTKPPSTFVRQLNYTTALAGKDLIGTAETMPIRYELDGETGRAWAVQADGTLVPQDVTLATIDGRRVMSVVGYASVGNACDKLYDTVEISWAPDRTATNNPGVQVSTSHGGMSNDGKTLLEKGRAADVDGDGDPDLITSQTSLYDFVLKTEAHPNGMDQTKLLKSPHTRVEVVHSNTGDVVR